MTFDEAIAYVRKNGTSPAEEEIVVSSGVEVRRWKFKAGNVMISHVHDYDHLSFLLSGEGTLRANGIDRDLAAPCMVEIKAGIEHAFYAKTDVSWDCVHALKEHA